MEPDELFYICMYRWFRKLAQLSGIDLFLDEFKPIPRTYVLILVVYILLMTCTWTIYMYPFEEKLICTIYLCFCCQGIVKIHSFLNNTRETKDLCDFSLKIYRANKKPSPNKMRLEKSVNITILIFKGGVTLLILTAILTVMKPCISYFLTGKVEMIIPAYFPGIDERTIVGYTFLAVLHSYLLFVFVIGTSATDLGLMTLVIQSHAMSHIFRNAVNEFNDLVVKDKRHRNSASLKNLILMHIDFIKYTRNLKTIYKEMCLIQITMANSGMIVLVYIILLMDYFPAYFYMATAFFQVFEYSLLGTIVEISNDRMYSTICEISFIDLPTSDQKKVILMTLLAQRPHKLTIGGFEPLNVETFISAMKTTYTVGMLLINTQMQ